MQVILKQNVPSLGRKGEVVNVKPGYLRFLTMNKLAEVATQAKISASENMKKTETVQKEMVLGQAQEIQKKLKGLKITLKSKARGDTLYGSITEKEILAAIEEKAGVALDKHHLVLSEHIKVLGNYEIPVRLMKGVDAKFTLEVKADK